MQISDFFYTENQVAKVLGISRMTVWRWIKDGRFDVQRVGGVVFIPKDEVELVKKEVKRNGKREISLVSNEKQLE